MWQVYLHLFSQVLSTINNPTKERRHIIHDSKVSARQLIKWQSRITTIKTKGSLAISTYTVTNPFHRRLSNYCIWHFYITKLKLATQSFNFTFYPHTSSDEFNGIELNCSSRFLGSFRTFQTHKTFFQFRQYLNWETEKRQKGNLSCHMSGNSWQARYMMVC